MNAKLHTLRSPAGKVAATLLATHALIESCHSCPQRGLHLCTQERACASLVSKVVHLERVCGSPASKAAAATHAGRIWHRAMPAQHRWVRGGTQEVGPQGAETALLEACDSAPASGAAYVAEKEKERDSMRPEKGQERVSMWQKEKERVGV
eukprot:1161820-Pelagomonas_calceolata.AAC.4